MEKPVPAYEGKDSYLFISYAHRDSERVLPVLGELFEKKIRFWYDEGIAPGSEWPKNIEDHLKGAAAFVIFVSENSLQSRNCENEVRSAMESGRKIYTVSMDGAQHPKLPASSGNVEAVSMEELAVCIPESFTGDGIRGYERSIGNAKRRNLWNILIGVAVLLCVLLGAGLYGLNEGVFDDYLPGLKETVTPEEYTAQETEGPVSITGDSELKALIADAAGREDLNREIPFQTEAAEKCLCEALGFQGKGNLKYLDLVENSCEELFLEAPDDEVLGYMAFLPNLKRIRIRGGSVSTLEPLLSCEHLETVYADYGAFPFEIPETAAFEVEYMN